MKKIPIIINLGFVIIATIGLCTYIGYKLNNVAIGIIVGFVLSLGYLLKIVFKK